MSVRFNVGANSPGNSLQLTMSVRFSIGALLKTTSIIMRECFHLHSLLSTRNKLTQENMLRQQHTPLLLLLAAVLAPAPAPVMLLLLVSLLLQFAVPLLPSAASVAVEVELLVTVEPQVLLVFDAELLLLLAEVEGGGVEEGMLVGLRSPPLLIRLLLLPSNALPSG